MHKNTRYSLKAYVEGLKKSDIRILSKLLSLTASHLDSDRMMVSDILYSENFNDDACIRIGITGAPGVGKSSFIETLGLHVAALNEKLAVLSIDPSSDMSGGSLLGDKTRMEQLSKQKNVFIRPQASGTDSGGVFHGLADAVTFCHMAGYNIVFVESVGAGQKEVAVSNYVDYTIMLLEPGAGDEIQGLKKGILETIDFLFINKSDGLNATLAKQTAMQYHITLNTNDKIQILNGSAHEGSGIAELWGLIQKRIEVDKNTLAFSSKRKNQKVYSLRQEVVKRLIDQLNKDTNIYSMLTDWCEENEPQNKASRFEFVNKVIEIFKNKKSE